MSESRRERFIRLLKSKSDLDIVEFTHDGVRELIEMLEEPERKGTWIYDGFDHPHGIEWCHCSQCGNCESVDSVYTQVDIYPYCAKCGARMEVDNER